jgi:hypothetical protein
MKRCAACGTDNDVWRPFCTRCGASYTGAAAEPVLGTPPPGAPPVPPAPGVSAPHSSTKPPRRRPSSKVVLIASVVAVAVAVSAFVGLTATGSKGKASAPTTTFPPTWDPRVIELVQFDAKERGLDYAHPVKVEFLSTAAFKQRVTSDDSKLSAKDKRDIQNTVSALRAMGMVQGNLDLFKQVNQLEGSSVEAFYDPEKKEVVVPGDTLDVEQKVVLSHELTHTLDDEHFDLTKLDKIGDQHDTDAVTALEEGDAVTVQNAYIAKLSPADRRAWERSQDTGGADEADLKDVPKIVEVLQQWPYDFGPLFVSILKKEGGESRVNEAFRSPPIDQEQVIDPISYLDGDQPGPISLPTLPKGAKKLDSGKEFGALQWFLVLSERIDPHVALNAALGWGADSYSIAQEGTQTCLEVHYRGETKRDNAQMLTALHQWIAALPKGMAKVTANADETLSLHSCDPGTKVKVVTNRSVVAYQLLLFRDTLIQQLIQTGADPTIASCVSDAITAQTSAAGVAQGQAPAVLSNPSAIQQIGATCRATASTVVPPDEIDK